MAQKVFMEVTVEGTVLQGLRSITIAQGVADHHSFEVVVPGTAIESDPSKSENVFKKIAGWIGKPIAIDWETGSFTQKGGGKDRSCFRGLVTHVSVSGSRKSHLWVTIVGKSPTILLDGIRNSETYANVTLPKLFDACTEGSLVSEVEVSEKVSFKDAVPFLVQYNETDFDFLRRVFQEHGEWMYYDGEALCLGLRQEDTVTLSPHHTMRLDFSYGASVPVNALNVRDYLGDKEVLLKPAKPSHGDEFASKVLSASDGMYPAFTTNWEARPSFPEGDDTHDTTKLLQRRLDSDRESRSNGVFMLLGTSDLAELYVGCYVKLDGQAHGGEYVITRITHMASGSDNYRNEFEAIPADRAMPPLVRTSRPAMGPCIAQVTDNKDPKKLGRVRVKFDWGKDETPWLRVVWPHAGKGRGFYFVPEIGDEVMVDFEMGQSAHPFVTGSVYNGKNAQDKAYDDKDKFKVIRTISGNEVLFDDNGALIIRNNKNMVELNCADDGTIRIQTEGDIEIQADKNIRMVAGKDFELVAGGSIAIEAGKDMKVSVAKKLDITAEDNMGLKTGKNMDIGAGQGLKLVAQSKAELTGMNAEVKSTASTTVKSDGNTVVKGMMVSIN